MLRECEWLFLFRRDFKRKLHGELRFNEKRVNDCDDLIHKSLVVDFEKIQNNRK